MPEKLTSLQNPNVKGTVALQQAKYRAQTGLILIEGRHPVEEALKANLAIHTIYLKEDELPLDTDLPQIPVTEAVMAKMATTDSPPPMLAIAQKPSGRISDFTQATGTRILGLVGLQDPGNVGTLIRAACAFGITGIVLLENHSDPYQPKVIRSSAGLVFRLPVVSLPGLAELKQTLTSFPELQIYAADAHQGDSYRAVNYSGDVLLLLGSEANGLSPEALNWATPVKIPMTDTTESLNVAMAGAIVLAEMYQQSSHQHG